MNQTFTFDWQSLLQAFLTVAETYWYALTVTVLLVSSIMVFVFLPSIFSNFIRREGIVGEKFALNVFFFFPFFPVILIRAGINWLIKKMKDAGAKLEESGSFNHLLTWSRPRQILYFISEYSIIALITIILYFALSALSPDAFAQMQGLVASSNGEIASFSISELFKVVFAIIIPKTASGWIFIGIAFWCATAYLAGMFFEPFKSEDKRIANTTTDFCDHFAKKWANQISCISVILTIPELIEKFTGNQVGLTGLFGGVEIYLIVFMIISTICFIPLALIIWGIHKLINR